GAAAECRKIGGSALPQAFQDCNDVAEIPEQHCPLTTGSSELLKAVASKFVVLPSCIPSPIPCRPQPAVRPRAQAQESPCRTWQARLWRFGMRHACLRCRLRFAG